MLDGGMQLTGSGVMLNAQEIAAITAAQIQANNNNASNNNEGLDHARDPLGLGPPPLPDMSSLAMAPMIAPILANTTERELIACEIDAGYPEGLPIPPADVEGNIDPPPPQG